MWVRPGHRIHVPRCRQSTANDISVIVSRAGYRTEPDVPGWHSIFRGKWRPGGTKQLVDSFFFLADGNGNPIVDQGGSPIIVNIPELEETDEDYVNTQIRGIVTVTGRRTTVTVSGRVSNQDYEETPRDEDRYRLDVSVTRDLGSNLHATLTGSADQVESNATSDNETYDARFSLTKALSPRSTTALTLGYRDYNDDAPGESYTEKRIAISFTTTYL